jgi:hypothetical protein
MKYIKPRMLEALGEYQVECSEDNGWALDIDNGQNYDARMSIVLPQDSFVALRDMLNELILVLELDKA